MGVRELPPSRIASVGVCLGVLALGVSAVAAAASPRRAARDGGGREFIFHHGHVLGAPESSVAFIVVRRGSRLIDAEVNHIYRAPTRCVNLNTGEVRRSTLDLFLPDFRLIHHGFHLSRTTPGNAFWNGPGGIAIPPTDYELSGRFTDRGTKGSGTFSAHATLHRKWDCAAGRYRWHTHGH